VVGVTTLAHVCDAGPYHTDKHSSHGYLPWYEMHLPARSAPVTLLEIGVFGGESLKLWAAWFVHPDTRIIGVERDERLAYDSPPKVRTDVCDIKEYEPTETYDVVIDDGSHLSSEIMSGFYRLWERVKPGGLYVIEDWAVQNELSPCYVEMCSRLNALLHEEGDVAAMYIHPQIWFLRKEGSAGAEAQAEVGEGD
jgi:trans-aconitate methyltransferase